MDADSEFVRSVYNSQQLLRWAHTAYAPLSSLWSFAPIACFAVLAVVRIIKSPLNFSLQLVMLGVLYLAIGECLVALRESALLSPGPFPVSHSNAMWGAIGFVKFFAMGWLLAVHGFRSGAVPAALCFFLGNILGHTVQYARFRVRSAGIPDVPTLGLTVFNCLRNLAAMGIVFAFVRYA